MLGDRLKISIHAPRTGSDWARRMTWCARRYFNPRSPHGERLDLTFSIKAWVISIHAPRTGSDQPQRVEIILGNISIHAPRTGSDRKERKKLAKNLISIHAPRTGSDDACILPDSCFRKFQSTLPARGATPDVRFRISAKGDFNPRSPHGERRALPIHPRLSARFQSTLPARGATWERVGMGADRTISIHAPRTGSDLNSLHHVKRVVISIHAPRTGSDPNSSFIARHIPAISIHAPRTGSDSVISSVGIQNT